MTDDGGTDDGTDGGRTHEVGTDRAARRAAERARAIAYLDLDEGRGPVPILDSEAAGRLLLASRRIAVVGASSNPGRPSFGVGSPRC